ncbi:MAG: hypothetical protein QXE82_05205 [Candidatus Nitrosotenuis sp.]
MSSRKNKTLSLEERVKRLEEIVFGTDYSSKKFQTVEKLIIDQIDDISTQHLVVIALKLKPKQTRQEIKKILEDWGKVVGDWFKGGNMNNRLIKMNIIKKDSVNEKNDDIFVLTKKGELLADELIKKLNMKND